MKLLYLIDRIEKRGGTERHLYDLAEGMLAQGHDVTIAVLQGGDYLEQFKLLPDLKTINLQVVRIYGLTGLRGLFNLKKLLDSETVDIIQTFHAGSDILGPIAAKISKHQPVILSSRRDMGYTKNVKLQALQRLINHGVDHILANSLEVKKSVMSQEKVAEDKISVIYNGIEFHHQLNEVFYADLVKKYQHSDSIIIGSLGNIRPVKGYEELIEAAALVLEERPNTLFLVAGFGVTDDMLHRISALGIADRFAFIGAIDSTEIFAFLRFLDIYVQPSRSEGFSNSVLEAMAAGLPIIVTDVGGNKEIVEHQVDGIKVPPMSPMELKNGICFYLNYPDIAQKYGNDAKNKVMNKFLFEAMLNNYLRFYSDQIKKKL